MRTTYASKPVQRDGMTRTKRYRYYTSKLHGSADRSDVERLLAGEIERIVLNGLREHLRDERWLAKQVTVHEVETTFKASRERSFVLSAAFSNLGARS